MGCCAASMVATFVRSRKNPSAFASSPDPSVLRTAPPTPQSFGQLPLEKGSSKRSGFVAYGEELTGHAAVPVQARKTRESDVHRYDCGCDSVMSQDLHTARLEAISSRAPTCPGSGSPPFQGGAGVVSCLELFAHAAHWGSLLSPPVRTPQSCGQLPLEKGSSKREMPRDAWVMSSATQLCWFRHERQEKAMSIGTTVDAILS